MYIFSPVSLIFCFCFVRYATGEMLVIVDEPAQLDVGIVDAHRGRRGLGGGLRIPVL